ncbi:MAG: hypothetical protein FWH53_08930 [Leptospirales bacterium]|nr:hypothetical protein [Leptospirales bacterium]
MKKLVVFIFGLMLFFIACGGSDDSDDSLHSIDPQESSMNFSRTFWGEWIRMDTGEVWYITSNSIKVNNKDFTTNVTLSKQSDRVIEVTDGSRKYYLYAARVATSSFSGKVVSIDSNTKNLMRAASLGGIGGIDVIISNLNDKTEELTVTTDNDGNFTVDEIIAGDEYEIKTQDQSTVVLPHANGDDVGTISVTDGVNFKTTIRPYSTSTDMNWLYANSNTYSFNIEIENTGTQDCTAATYSLVPDSDLTISGSSSGILGTIEPQKKKIIALNVSCKEIQNEYEFKKINIIINDTISRKSWDDSVSIKFNKEMVSFYIRSQSNRPVAGVVITPTAKAYSFKTNGGSASLTMPWSTKDYLIVFSGATADTEAAYSLGINMVPYTDYSNFLDLGNYEPNNTETEATLIEGQDTIMSYLHKNDIDYYRIKLGTSATVVNPISITDYAIKDYNGNNDVEVNPGETNYLDIRIRNNTAYSIKIDRAILSSTSPYVTINNAYIYLGDNSYPYPASVTLGSGYYLTLTDYYVNLYSNPSQGYYTYTSASNAKLLCSSYLYRAFRFTIASDCPVGTQLPFTVTFDNNHNYYNQGYFGTDTLTIPVVATGASIAISTPIESNFAIMEAANGNDDGKANPGETHYLDILVKNSGTSNVLGLQAVLSTTNNSDVTIDNGTVTIGNLNAGYYKTLTYASGDGYSSGSSADLLDLSSLASAFRFTIDSGCPVGTELPFTVTFTDSWGNVWTDNLTIPVQ